VHDFYRAAPGGVPTQVAFSQNRRYPKLDLDRANGCIRDKAHAYSTDGGLAVLYGNIAEKGCVVKTAGVDDANLKFTGRARVCQSQEEAVEKILADQIVAGDIVVVVYEGPKGGPGMQEMLYPTSYLKSKGMGKVCALLTDGRFSGGTSGLSIGHASPEAAAGGAIGLVEEGDTIEIDIPNRRIHLVIEKSALAARRSAMEARGVDAWKPMDRQEPKPLKLTTTADHTKFKELQKTFNSGPEVTKACLACHTEAAGQIHRTKHWKWEYTEPRHQAEAGQEDTSSTTSAFRSPSNYAACTSCHIGYGWKDARLRLQVRRKRRLPGLPRHHRQLQEAARLRRQPGDQGHRVSAGLGQDHQGIDLSKIAQKVGKTSRDTCGACHFNGGGGDGVKHGDLDSSLAAPDKDSTCTWTPKASTSPAHLPQDRRPRGRRQPLHADRQGQAGAHLRGKADKQPGHLRRLPRQRPHKIGRQAQPPHRQDRLPDLPHPEPSPAAACPPR
jgi:hypothetical protein